jgi:hypothetical protein
VNGVRILCDEKTQVLRQITAVDNISIQGCSQVPIYVGEVAIVHGSKDKNKQSIQANWIEFPLPQFAGDVSGSAVIDALPARSTLAAQQGDLLLRADGYSIQVTSKTKTAWTAPLQSLVDVKAGDWIDYEGKLSAAGVLIASWTRIGPNVIQKKDEERRANNDFDPSTVPPSAKQSRWTLGFEGIDPKKFPPYNDPVMQARISEIGNKLVPAYQRELPDSDPAKIHFRFQLIDTKLFRYAVPLVSGIILVPHQVAERMQNDAQLAAILADGVASVIEKQAYGWSPATGKLRAGALAAEVAGSSVPFVALAGTITLVSTEKKVRWDPPDQSVRVSLDLLNDAGYDIDQAPVAWWLLASKPPKPISEISLPYHTTYLYGILGECWHNPRAAAAAR